MCMQTRSQTIYFIVLETSGIMKMKLYLLSIDLLGIFVLFFNNQNKRTKCVSLSSPQKFAKFLQTSPDIHAYFEAAV